MRGVSSRGLAAFWGLHPRGEVASAYGWWCKWESADASARFSRLHMLLWPLGLGLFFSRGTRAQPRTHPCMDACVRPCTAPGRIHVAAPRTEAGIASTLHTLYILQTLEPQGIGRPRLLSHRALRPLVGVSPPRKRTRAILNAQASNGLDSPMRKRTSRARPHPYALAHTRVRQGASPTLSSLAMHKPPLSPPLLRLRSLWLLHPPHSPAGIPLTRRRG